MGLNNQNLHNFLFRGFLKPWEEYTGAKINWIDLAQADYNARLQQSIATGTVDFDIIEMGAPFEGDVCGKGLASEMPDWVAKQIEMDDYVGYLQGAGRHLGRQDLPHLDRRRLPHLQLPHRRLLRRRARPRHGRPRADRATGACRRPGSRCRPSTKFLKGKQVGRPGRATAILDPAQGLGRLRLLLPRQPRHRLRQAPRRQGLAVRSGHDEAAGQQPGLGARHPGRDRRAAVASRPTRSTPIPNTTAFSQFLAGTGSMLAWWGDVGSNVKTNDASVVGDVTGFSILPGSDDVYNTKTGAWDKLASGPNFAPNMAYIGWGVYVMATRRQRREEAEGGVELPRPISAARTSRSGWRPIRRASSPTATRISTSPSGWRPATTRRSSAPTWSRTANSYNHPNAAIEPRIPGIFQYYSIAEDELAKIFAGQYDAQQGADNIAAAWEKITDQIGRENQIKLYKASLGM